MKQNILISEFWRMVEIERKFSKKILFELLKNKDFAKPQTMFLLNDLQENGKRRLKEIAEATGHSSQNLCILYAKLEKEGLISHEIDASNRRNTYYFITAKGKKYFEKNEKKAQALAQSLLDKISAENTEKFYDSLKTVNDILEYIIKEN